MTEKLYYLDAYIKDFTANVLSAVKTAKGYDVILDKTAFFPEEGGQSSDTGSIGASRVLHVYEVDGIIHHITDTEPEGVVECHLDFDDRFVKMQCHTAEHIVCGIIHRLFGYDNVGFHIGDDEVTFDISSPLDRSDLDRVEELANEAVFANLEVTTSFPSADELASLSYRSKLELVDNVRIVTIGDVDTCACCAPHVSYTGEIGLIKLLDSFKHRGGMRITLVAGRRALLDYTKKYTSARRISAMLSAPQDDIADALDAYMKETEALRYRLSLARKAITDIYAASIPETDGTHVLFLDDMSYEELRDVANSAKGRVNGLLVLLSGTDGEYKYVISSETADLSSEIRLINSALNGKGGGRGTMVQGTMRATAAAIREYFIEITD